jgi:hypothetical protein
MHDGGHIKWLREYYETATKGQHKNGQELEPQIRGSTRFREDFEHTSGGGSPLGIVEALATLV